MIKSVNAKIAYGLTVACVLGCLWKNPRRHLLWRWNWKTACLSSFCRGIIILMVNLPSGADGAASAMFLEICYRGITSGFFSAAIQAFRFARPAWTASLVAMVLIPCIADSMESLLHIIRGTQRMGPTIMASFIVTAISTLLELFLMRRGVMLAGQSESSLMQDVKKILTLIAVSFKEVGGWIKTLLAKPQKALEWFSRNLDPPTPQNSVLNAGGSGCHPKIENGKRNFCEENAKRTAA